MLDGRPGKREPACDAIEDIWICQLEPSHRPAGYSLLFLDWCSIGARVLPSRVPGAPLGLRESRAPAPSPIGMDGPGLVAIQRPAYPAFQPLSLADPAPSLGYSVSPEFSALPLADHRPFREANLGIDATDPCSGDRGVAGEQRRGLCWLAGVDFGAVTCPWAALATAITGL